MNHRCPKLTFRESEKLIIYLFIYTSRLCALKRDLSSYAVLGYMRTVENLSALQDVVWGIKYRSFRTLNTLKYPPFLPKMIKANSPLVCPLCFFVIFTVLGFLCHHCSPLHKAESRHHSNEDISKYLAY